MNDVGRLVRGTARIARTRYPAFIFGLPLPRGEMPVFTYHDVDTPSFTSDLEFLSTNGYRTLKLDEYLDARQRGRSIRKGVLLTFDDARQSFWSVALPLLRSYEAHAALFAPTYWMSARSPEKGDDLFMSWEQLRDCAASGHVDVQSHAHRHALVATSNALVDFANPQALARFDVYDWPIRCIAASDELGRPLLGTPIYRSAPLLSVARRYIENDEVTQACRDLVDRRGGPDYFRRSHWRTQLTRFHHERARRSPGRFMDARALRDLLASEFELSRAAFIEHLGYAPTAIAYPWMIGSALSLELARSHGLRAAFGSALDYRTERRGPRLPVQVFGRLKCDWLQLLPGRQRRSVLVTLARKLSRFAAAQHLAH